MKKFKNFILEGNMDTENFQFRTKLSDREIYFTNYDKEYDDHDDLNATVLWHIKFEWMGDDGIDYYVNVDKIELEYTAIIFKDDEDIQERKTLTIEDPDKIKVEIRQRDISSGYPNNSRQLIPNEIEIDGDNALIIF